MGENIIFALVMIALALLIFFVRRGGRSRALPYDAVRALLSEVKLNQGLVEVYSVNGRVKRFETVSWQLNKDRLDFLNKSLQAVLVEAFGIAEDYNQQIKAARKHKSGGYVPAINVNKLRESLAKSKEGLEMWLMSKVGTKDTTPKYPGIMDSLFGGRS